MSQAPSTYNRKALEKYHTPAWVTEGLLSKRPFAGRPLLDPFAGAGHMLDAFAAGGFSPIGWDIEPERDDIARLDFFEVLGLGDVDVCSNPPYGKQGRLAHKLIRKALELTRPHRGTVAMLLPADWDSGSTRRDVFADHPAFAGRYVLNKRIRWENVEHSVDKNGRLVDPTVNHTWFVWSWSKDPKADPTAGYLP